MNRVAMHVMVVMIAFLFMGCAAFTPIHVEVERIGQPAASTKFLTPLLMNLKDCGHQMAGVMLDDYRYTGVKKTADNNTYVYQFEPTSGKYKKLSFVIVHFKDNPHLLTHINEKAREGRDLKYRVWLKNIAFCLVQSEDPASIEGNKVRINYQRSTSSDAAMAFCLGEQTKFDMEMLLWFRSGESMKELVSLLISAFPRIEYTQK